MNLRFTEDAIKTIFRLEAEKAELMLAAQAVIDQWDSPKWKDQEPTGAVIHKLRVVIERLKEEG